MFPCYIHDCLVSMNSVHMTLRINKMKTPETCANACLKHTLNMHTLGFFPACVFNKERNHFTHLED